jgi:hypothetical protein
MIMLSMLHRDTRDTGSPIFHIFFLIRYRTVFEQSILENEGVEKVDKNIFRAITRITSHCAGTCTMDLLETYYGPSMSSARPSWSASFP